MDRGRPQKVMMNDGVAKGLKSLVSRQGHGLAPCSRSEACEIDPCSTPGSSELSEGEPVRVERAKEEEQKAFLDTFRRVLSSHNVHKELSSVSQAMKFLRESIRKGPSPLNGELAREVFLGTRLFPLLERAVSFFEPPDTTKDLFGKARRAAVKQGAPDSGRSLWYLLRHPRAIWSGFTSSWFGHKLVGKVCPFDPKGRNISGLLFEEKIGDHLSLDWTMGPTPTVGDVVAPEMERAIESLESHEKWVYVNLQSLGAKGERPRSLALLEASRKYCGRFYAASLSVDSPLYRGHEKIDIDEHRKRLLRELSRSIFLGEAAWYYFSLNAVEKEPWWSLTEEVVERAFSLSRGKSAVFHELVLLGLIRAWQAFHLKDVERMISTVACKECIDRGGSVNAAFLWAFLGDDVGEKERAAKVMAVLWGRPLLARKRLIEKSRTKGFEALVDALPPHVVRAYLEGIWNLVDCQL